MSYAQCGKHNAIKSRCPQGHPYDKDNTYYSVGRRFCRACQKEAATLATEKRLTSLGQKTSCPESSNSFGLK
jgi:hypothetical protein